MQTSMTRATVAAVRPAHATSRSELRAHGERFAERIQSLIYEIAHRHRPMPGGQLTRDLFKEGRGASLATYGAVLAAVALEHPSEVALIFVSLSAWLHSVRPLPPGAFRDAVLSESKEEGEQNIAAWAAADAVERHDVPALERLGKETAEHIVAAQHLLTVVEQELSKLRGPRPSKSPVRRIIANPRFLAAGATS